MADIRRPYMHSDEILVDRGFVPRERRDPATRPLGQVAGEVTVVGVARSPNKVLGRLRIPACPNAQSPTPVLTPFRVVAAHSRATSRRRTAPIVTSGTT